MTFWDAHQRLVRAVCYQMNCGEFTERGFARRASMSQPGAHKAFSGQRRLSWRSADDIRAALRMRSVLELATDEELAAELQRRVAWPVCLASGGD